MDDSKKISFLLGNPGKILRPNRNKSLKKFHLDVDSNLKLLPEILRFRFKKNLFVPNIAKNLLSRQNENKSHIKLKETIIIDNFIFSFKIMIKLVLRSSSYQTQ